jgi:Na+-transporting NADH:ubiquinone oxidoreductase subunit C
MSDSIMNRLKATLAQPNDSTQKTLFVALTMCLVCSVLVSAAAILLRPTQAVNAALDRKRNIVEVAGLMESGNEDVEAAFSNVQSRFVNLDTGEFTDELTGVEYDQYAAARDPSMSVALTAEDDIAGIGRRARFAEVYLIGGDGSTGFEQIVLPVHGLGLWSTLYGFVSLEGDLATISGLKFYDHAETPGLGGEVDNANWQSKWKGKLAFDEAGQVQIEVVKGVVDARASNAAYQVDGLAGATLTSRGVSQLLRFWLDEQGFGKFIKNLKQGEIS